MLPLNTALEDEPPTREGAAREGMRGASPAQPLQLEAQHLAIEAGFVWHQQAVQVVNFITIGCCSVYNCGVTQDMYGHHERRAQNANLSFLQKHQLFLMAGADCRFQHGWLDGVAPVTGSIPLRHLATRCQGVARAAACHGSSAIPGRSWWVLS